jgi:hypothetical protein
MANLHATLFVQVAAERGHRRRYGKLPRVLLPGAKVDVATKAQRDKWAAIAGSAGLLEDQLIAFAKKNGFKPTKHLPAGAARNCV